jgi:hypothetical protein
MSNRLLLVISRWLGLTGLISEVSVSNFNLEDDSLLILKEIL